MTNIAKKILVIDDDPILRRTFHQALQAKGFNVSVAPDAVTALSQAKNQKPDLIILDLGLPGGGGFTFLERLKVFPALSVIPIVVVSGLDRSTSEKRARDAGVSEYLAKPVAPETIVEHAQRILGGA